MTIKERFLQDLKQAIPGIQYLGKEAHPEYEGSITIPARHAAVGDMIVEVEDDDIRVHIGHITHCHFNWYPEDGDSEVEGQTRMVQEAIEFLKDVFHDKIVFWKGWWMDGSFSKEVLSTIKRKKRVRYYLWSGPV